MDYQLVALFLLIPAFGFGYSVGQWSKEYPTEEEMMSRIIAGRVEKRLRKEIESALADEINRQAAH